MAKLYQVDISPEATNVLIDWVNKCEEDNREEAVEELLNSYEIIIDTLEKNPKAGTARLKDIPTKYRAIHIWKHLWAVYQIWSEEEIIKIEYIIDDRQNYKFVLR